MIDPTNAARQARFRKARALGFEYVSGYLPPKRAAKVRQWLTEAEQSATQSGPRGENISAPESGGKA